MTLGVMVLMLIIEVNNMIYPYNLKFRRPNLCSAPDVVDGFLILLREGLILGCFHNVIEADYK